MARRTPSPQEESVQLNLSTQYRVKEKLRELALEQGTDMSKIVTKILLREFGMS